MKVLILSCNTGGGHNTAGRAVKEELDARGIPCEMKDALSFGAEKTSRIVSGGYVTIAKQAPHVFGYIYQAGDTVSSWKIRSPVYFANTLYAKKLYQYIMDHDYDTIVCPHLFPAEALTYIRAKFHPSFRCYAVATDYVCIPFWEETKMDAYFIPHPDLIEEFAQKGIPREKLVVTGIPVSSSFLPKLSRTEARACLGLNQEKKIYLVMTGSMGFGDTSALVEKMVSDPEQDYFSVVLTGNNDKLKSELDAAFSKEKVLAVPFTNQVALYMDACDVLLTKPGGLSSTEAAVKNVPFVHTAPIPGCETKNASFFSSRKMSFFAPDLNASAAMAAELMENPEKQRMMIEAQQKNINGRAAADICDYIENQT